MKKLALVLLLFMGFISYSQTDSTDLNYTMTDPILLDEMDSLMFSPDEFGQLYLDFDVSDTISFDGFNIEIFTIEDDEVLYKGNFLKSEMLTNNQLDSNWHVTLNLGKLEKGVNYSLIFLLKDFNGLLSGSIIKQFIYEIN